MSEEQSHSEAFDDSLDGLLPDDLQDVDPATKSDIYDSATFGSNVSEDEAKKRASAEMAKIADRLDLDESTVAMGEQIFDQYTAQKQLYGSVIEMLSAAALYCACKVEELPIDPTEFTDSSDEFLNRKRLLRRVKEVASVVGIDPSAFFGSTQYVAHYCDELGLSSEVEEAARAVIETCSGTGLASGKSPTGWAASAVYIAAKQANTGVTQSEIAAVANVTEVTIRNRYQEQWEYITQQDSVYDGEFF